MRFTPLELTDAHLIELEPRRDERGHFARTFCAREFEEHGLISTIAQCSTSFNERRGTVRGLHYQAAPHKEAKVVRCTAGSIFDVVVDVRVGSSTYGKWHGSELSASNGRMIYVPPGCAHGFQTLEDRSEVLYQISAAYVPEAGRGFRWDDPLFGITWPIRDAVTISDRDAGYPLAHGR